MASLPIKYENNSVVIFNLDTQQIELTQSNLIVGNSTSSVNSMNGNSVECFQCTETECNSVQCSNVQCSNVQCTQVQCSNVQCSNCTTIQCNSVQQQCNTVRCSDCTQCSGYESN